MFHYINKIFLIDPFSTALPSPLLSPSVPGLGSSSSSSSGASSLAFSHKPFTAAQQQRGGAMSKTMTNKTPSARAASHETQLSQEIWFHGPVSRKEAEDLLKHVSWIIFYDWISILTRYILLIGWRLFGERIARIPRPVRLDGYAVGKSQTLAPCRSRRRRKLNANIFC